MPQQKAITSSQYNALLKDIRAEMTRGLLRAQKTLEQQRLLTYWRIGRLISKYLLKDGSKSPYGTYLYSRLSDDLELTQDLLFRITHFYKVYPTQPQTANLTWTHYQCLLRIRDSAARAKWQQSITKEGITSTQFKQLMRAINAPVGQKAATAAGKLKVQRGIPYLYRVRQIKDLHRPIAEVEIDCGFDISIDKPAATTLDLQGGVNVRSMKQDNDYILKWSSAADDNLYTYKAFIERVVDGDTLIVKIDLGFGIRIRQRLRLRGINTPELRTVNGDRAQAFVQDQVKSLPFVVVKTYGSDKYDRYLADVFVLPAAIDPLEVAAKGALLNQQILDEGLGEVYI